MREPNIINLEDKIDCDLLNFHGEKLISLDNCTIPANLLLKGQYYVVNYTFLANSF